ADNKSHALVQSHFTNKLSDNEWKAWQESELQHDVYGRLTHQQIAWLADNQPGIDKTAISTQYLEDLNNHTLKTIETNALDESHTKHYDLRNNQYMSYQAPEGDLWQFRYDLLGRLTQTIDPRGNLWRKNYADFADAGLNAIDHESPLGHKTRTQFDALHRSLVQEDWHTNHWREIAKNHHNGFGQCIKTTDIFGLETHHSFDGEGRKILTIDPEGNQERFEYNDITQTSQTFLNDVKHQEMQIFPWRLTTIHKQLSNNHNPLDGQTCFLQTTQTDNALGLTSEIQIDLIDKLSSQIIESKRHTFEYDGSANPTLEIIRTDNGNELEIRRAFDLFHNSIKTNKKLMANGGVSEHQSEIHHFDQANRLIKIESQPDSQGRGANTYFHWNKNGNKIQTILPNGNDIVYDYLPGGLLIASRWQRGGKTYQVEREYDADGRLANIHDSESTKLLFNYTPNGHLTAIHYPNYHINFSYNSHDSLETITDSLDYTETLYYLADQPDKIAQRSIGNNQVHYIYGQDDNGHKGQVIQRHIIDGSTLNITKENLYYGALGTLSLIQQRNNQSGIVSDTLLTHNAKHLLTQIESSHQQGHGKKNHTTLSYGYDGFNRLTTEAFSDQINKIKHEYQYDANHNLIRQVIHSMDGMLDKIHTYNQRDQLISVTFNQEPPLVFDYDINGNLTQDDQGNQYTYDDRGFLLALSNKHQQERPINYKYWPNGLLASIDQTTDSKKEFYYNHQQHIQTILSKNVVHHFCQAGSGLILGTSNAQSSLQKLSQLNTHQSNSSTLIDENHQLHTLAYSAFGKSIYDDDHPLAQFAWKNSYRDLNTDLVYMTSRYLKTLFGRFINQDNYFTNNRYAFGQGNPILYADPFGHKSQAQSNKIMANYLSGSFMAVLGFFGALFAIPTGGASLSLTAGAGIAAGTSSVISGAALIGMQAAMDSGNKQAANILKDVSLGFGIFAALDIGVAIAPKIPGAISALSSGVSQLTENISSRITAWSSQAAESEIPGTMAASTRNAIPSTAVGIPSAADDIVSSTLTQSLNSTPSSLESSYASVTSTSSWLSESQMAETLDAINNPNTLPENLSEAANEIGNIPSVKKVRFKLPEYTPSTTATEGTNAAARSGGHPISAALSNVARNVSRSSRMAGQFRGTPNRLNDEQLLNYLFRINMHTPRPNVFEGLVPR
ncbi:MAG: hypothetical protein OXE99_04420, partial [Cellvibrionales bacterium]|nr:hypothetical protein [Cellvibrionales bacterium]